MGLEIVEVIMRVEEEFGIEIDDEEVSGLATVGQLYECVLGKVNSGLSGPGRKTWSEKEVWDTLHAALVDELSVAPEAITMEAHFIRDLDLG